MQVIGPIVGGFVAESRLGWHANFWIMLILSVITLVLGYIVTPETVSFRPISSLRVTLKSFCRLVCAGFVTVASATTVQSIREEATLYLNT